MQSVEEVIEGGMCIGCGSCTYNNDSSFMDWNMAGELIPVADVGVESKESKICPFSDQSWDETALAEVFFGSTLKKDNITGRYLKLYVGQVNDTEILNNSSSGGIFTWINKKLLDLNLVDGIIAVKESGDGKLFEYDICTDPGGLWKFAKSRYHPSELGSILDRIKGDGKKYALVTLPCYAKSVRNLQLLDDSLKDKIPFVFTLICGHLKTKNYSEYLGWQGGIAPDRLKSINFRVKDKTQLASKYSAQVTDDDSKVLIPYDNLKLNDWGLGLFKPKACDFCDDVFGELGDLTVGDAWLPEYIKDNSGNSVVIIRNPLIAQLFKQYSTELNLADLSATDLHRSQQGGILHKRSGLRARIDHYHDLGLKFPSKRTYLIPETISPKEKSKFISRLEVSEKSHHAFLRAKNANNLSLFYEYIKPEIRRYYRILRPLHVRALRRLRDLITK